MPPQTEEIEERLLTQATARVTWGDFPDEVQDFLVGEGLSASQARSLVRRLSQERNAEVRRRSGGKLLAGIAMLLAAGIYFYVEFKERTGRQWWDRILGAAFLWLGVSGIVAIWRGAWGLAIPSSEELTDVVETEEPPNTWPPLPGG